MKKAMQSPRLTASESKVLQDAQFFTTKASIDAKINDLFSVLKTLIEAENAEHAVLPAELLASPGRLYRGEHLGPLPWRALDCPRHFAGKDIFAFRTLLVWGREFSFHFLLGGHWLPVYGPQLGHRQLASRGWQMSCQDSPWDWALDGRSHVPLASLSPAQWQTGLRARTWLKLSIAHPLDAFEDIPAHGRQLWSELVASFQ